MKGRYCAYCGKKVGRNGIETGKWSNRKYYCNWNCLVLRNGPYSFLFGVAFVVLGIVMAITNEDPTKSIGIFFVGLLFAMGFWAFSLYSFVMYRNMTKKRKRLEKLREEADKRPYDSRDAFREIL